MIKSKPKPDDGKNPVGRPISKRVLVTLRIDPEIKAALMEGGRGWGERANTMLRRALKLD